MAPKRKQPLKETTTNAGSASSKAASTGSKKRKTTAANAQESTEGAQPKNTALGNDWKWIVVCPCRRAGDEEDSDDEDEDEDGEDAPPEEEEKGDDDDDVDETDADGNKLVDVKKYCVCYRNIDEHLKQYPDWKYLVTEKGKQLVDEFLLANDKCCPDALGMYIYNDFEAYGQTEIMENIMQKFHDAYASKKLSKQQRLYEIWAALEAAGIWFARSWSWQGTDDGPRVTALVDLWGSTILTVVKELHNEGLLVSGQDAPIRNLPLVLDLFMDLADMWGHMMGEEETPWSAVLEAAAKEWGGFTIKHIKDSELPSKADLEKAAIWKEWNHTSRFNKFKKSVGKLGGNYYDITTMSAAERKSHHFDKVDPLKDKRYKDRIPPKGSNLCVR